nr:uncharacterized protein LOC128670926 isoform X3 [Plodia interpunctella]
MLKFVIVFALVAVSALGAPSNPEAEARRALPALEHQEVHDDLGQYSLRYVTAEGTIVSETGRLIPTSDDVCIWMSFFGGKCHSTPRDGDSTTNN